MQPIMVWWHCYHMFVAPTVFSPCSWDCRPDFLSSIYWSKGFHHQLSAETRRLPNTTKQMLLNKKQAIMYQKNSRSDGSFVMINNLVLENVLLKCNRLYGLLQLLPTAVLCLIRCHQTDAAVKCTQNMIPLSVVQILAFSVSVKVPIFNAALQTGRVSFEKRCNKVHLLQRKRVTNDRAGVLYGKQHVFKREFATPRGSIEELQEGLTGLE